MRIKPASIKKTMKRRVTIKDIAAMAKVSIGTVDRVLHDRGEVNPETHGRVMQFVEELGYTPNLLAKSLALKKKFTIAVLIPHSKSNPYWSRPLDGFKSASVELSDFNSHIEIFGFDIGNELSFVHEFKRMLATAPDGIIMAPSFHDAALKLTPECRKRNIPYILIDNNLEDSSGFAYFGQDAFQSGIVAAKLMHYGISENTQVLILNLTGNKIITRHMQHREDGFVSYFNNEIPGYKIRTLSCAIDIFNIHEPVVSLKKLLHDHQDISGIFVTNSRAHQVAESLETLAVARLRLIGYDLVDANREYLKKGIIDFLIGQKPEDQGYKSAMAMFNYLLNNKKADPINYSSIDIIMKENIDYYK
jgi:LacI family transcriptional regulator